MFMYLHRASWHSSSNLTEVSPCFFLSFKANARVKPTKTGHSPHLSKIVVLFYVLFVLCRSVYCLCVNVYCTTATGFQPNCSNKYIISYHIIYHIISYHTISYHISHHISYHIPYHIVSYHIISQHIILYHITALEFPNFTYFLILFTVLYSYAEQFKFNCGASSGQFRAT